MKYKCTCGSQWESKTVVSECPFCHKSLKTDTDEPKTLSSVLVLIRDQMGVEMLGKGKAMLSCFKDKAPELKKEYNILTVLEKCDGVKILFEAKDKVTSEQERAFFKAVKIMVDDHAVQESAAQSVCHDYMLALTGLDIKVQKPDRQGNLTEFREKPKEQIPVKMAAAPQPATPAPPPKPAIPPKPAVAEFQMDEKGRLLKYNGNASIVRVPNHVKIIGAKAFHRNPLITHIILPDGLVSIEQEAFAVCPNLQSVSFPATLQYIGDKAFWACNALREVTLPGSVKTIVPLAFWACKGMTKVTLQEGITALGMDAFNYCSGLKEIYLPKSLKTVHPHAFTGAMDARVVGNSVWTVKDGHVVANTPTDTTYRNAGVSQKTVVAPPANPSRAEQPKPPVTPSKPPVPPEAVPAAKPAKKTLFIVRLLVACMYLPWGAAIIMFFDSVAPINTDGSYYFILLVALVLFLLGRLLYDKNRMFWGFLLSFFAAGNLIQFYEFSPDNKINEIIIFAYPVLCAFTSACIVPIFKRNKK